MAYICETKGGLKKYYDNIIVLLTERDKTQSHKQQNKINKVSSLI